MANDVPVSPWDSDLDAAAKPTKEADRSFDVRFTDRDQSEIRSLIRNELESRALMRDPVRALAANPEALAAELIETQETVRYMLYGLGFLAFIVWIMLRSGSRY